MARRFGLGRVPSGEAPEVQSITYTTGQTFQKGALVVVVAAGTISECGADPATVFGVALEPAGSRPGFDIGHSPSVVTGRRQEVSVLRANRTTIFSGRMRDPGPPVVDPMPPVQTRITETYGVVNLGSSEWVIDFSDITNNVVEILDIDISNNIFFFKFLESVIQTP